MEPEHEGAFSPAVLLQRLPAPFAANDDAVAPPRDSRVTIHDLVREYMAEYASRVKTLGFWSTVYGDIALADLNDNRVLQTLEDLSE